MGIVAPICLFRGVSEIGFEFLSRRGKYQDLSNFYSEGWKLALDEGLQHALQLKSPAVIIALDNPSRYGFFPQNGAHVEIIEPIDLRNSGTHIFIEGKNLEDLYAYPFTYDLFLERDKVRQYALSRRKELTRKLSSYSEDDSPFFFH